MLVELIDHLSELSFHFLILITFSIVFGGLGFVFILAFFQNMASKRWSEYLIIAVSFGLVSILLAVIGLSVFNIPLTKLNLSIFFLFLGGISVMRFLSKKRKSIIPYELFTLQDKWEILLLGILFFSILLIRTLQIDDVFVPNWFDGQIHSSLLQKFILEENISIDRIYHVGFHAIALFINKFLGTTIPQTVLILGEWLSVICGITFYSFVRRYTRHTYVAFLSVTAYSLYLFFPSYLLSWSRYPFLLGITLLPCTILISIDWITNHKGNYYLTLIMIISLFISHYGSFLIWFSFVMAHLLYKFTIGHLTNNASLSGKSIVVRLSKLFFPLLLIVFPKAINLWGRQDLVARMLLRVNSPDFDVDTLNVMNLVLDKNSLFVLIWILVCLWTFMKGKRIFSIILIWPLMVLFLTWIQYYFLGISITNYSNFLIFCSMPIAISFGLLFFRLWLSISKLIINWWPTTMGHIGNRGINFLFVFAIIPGFLTNFEIINPETIVFSEEDKLAMDWIENNTPSDAIFLIRSTLWGDDTFMPSDGGGWIGFLTGRNTVFPQAIGELYDICVFASEKEAKYIYFGKQSGEIPFDLRLSDLDKKSYLIVYETQNVKIVYLLC